VGGFSCANAGDVPAKARVRLMTAQSAAELMGMRILIRLLDF
jgi:hypothetical protein